MYYLASAPDDLVFSSNMVACNGVLTSPSFVRLLDERLSGAVSVYEVLHSDRNKEAKFEEIRKKHYPTKPSRLGAIFLFPDLKTALRANEKWWGSTRKLHETSIQNVSVVLLADSQWLNCEEDNYETNAHNYFQEVQSSEPLMEIVVMGMINVTSEPINT